MPAWMVTLRHGLPFLVVNAQGSPTQTELWQLVDLIDEASARTEHDSVILSLLEMELDESFSAHRQLLAHAARRLSRLESIAIVSVTNSLDINEVVARSLGLKLRLFTDRVEAARWTREEGNFRIARLSAEELAYGFIVS